MPAWMNQPSGLRPKPERWNAVLGMQQPVELYKPMRYRKPRVVTVTGADLFGPSVPSNYIGLVFSVRWKAYRHQFRIVTDCPARAQLWVGGCTAPDPDGFITHNGKPAIGPGTASLDGSGIIVGSLPDWPLANVNILPSASIPPKGFE